MHLTSGCFGEFQAIRLKENIRSSLQPLSKFDDGTGLLYQKGQYFYLAAHLSRKSLQALMIYLLQKANIEYKILPAGARMRTSKNKEFYFNFSKNAFSINNQNLNQGELAYFSK